ncbi:MAG TPA: ankyrin repeat domain-containing protein, partial [Opitutales bacterium]|nr:ankyrin repeat domain-containing protein [Opitutales bacterium]
TEDTELLSDHDEADVEIPAGFGIGFLNGAEDESSEEAGDDDDPAQFFYRAVLIADLDDVAWAINQWPDSINAVNAQGDTPLHVAVEQGDLDIIALLVQAGARIDIANASGKTAWRLACDMQIPLVFDTLARSLRERFWDRAPGAFFESEEPEFRESGPGR